MKIPFPLITKYDEYLNIYNYLYMKLYVRWHELTRVPPHPLLFTFYYISSEYVYDDFYIFSAHMYGSNFFIYTVQKSKGNTLNWL